MRGRTRHQNDIWTIIVPKAAVNSADPSQRCRFSRNVDLVTPKTIYFYYQKNTFLESKYPKIILFNFEKKLIPVITSRLGHLNFQVKSLLKWTPRRNVNEILILWFKRTLGVQVWFVSSESLGGRILSGLWNFRLTGVKMTWVWNFGRSKSVRLWEIPAYRSPS